MAKLPDETALGERQAPEPMGRGFHLAEIKDPGVEARAQQQLGQAVQHVGDAVFKVENEIYRARQASQLSDVMGQASTELGQKSLEFQRDQDFKTSPTRFRAAAAEIGKKYQGSFNNDIQREAFNREYGRLSTANHLNVLTAAARQEGDYNVANLDTNLDVYAKSAAAAQNQYERDVIVNQARLAIAEQKRAGWITDVDAEKRTRGFEAKLEHASVVRDINTDATKTLSRLTADPAYATALDPLTKQTLIHSAQVREQQNRQRTLPDEARQDAEKAMIPPAAEPSVRTVSSQSPVGTSTKPSANDIRANLGKWVANAEKEAEARHPGDLVYRDLVVGRVKNYVGTIVAAQEGEQRQAYMGLMGVLGGAVPGVRKPTTQDELFAVPGAMDSYVKLDPQQQSAVLMHINHNANESIGKPAQVNARLVNSIFPQLFLDVNDPKAIYKPEQLAQFVPQGLTPEGHSVLARKIEELKTPEGKGAASMIEKVNRSAHVMLLRSIPGSLQPENAEYGALLFRDSLGKKIEEYRAAKKDIGPLITAGSPDYFGKPENVMRFLSATPQQAVAEQAAKEKPPPVSEMAKLDAKDPQASFDALKPGAWFVTAGGQVGRKPPEATAAPAPAAPKPPVYAQWVERVGPKSGSYRVNAPVKSSAGRLSGQTYESKEAALEALRQLYEGIK